MVVSAAGVSPHETRIESTYGEQGPRAERAASHPWVGNPRSTPRWIGSAQREITTFCLL